MFAFLRKLKKLATIIIFAGLIVGLLYLLLTFLIPFFVLANEGAVLKAELDNPYMDANYEGWHTVDVRNWGSCLFPNEWNVSENQSIVQITDSSGNIIALGTVLGHADSVYDSIESFLSDMLDYPVTGVEYEHISDFVRIQDSYMEKVTASGDSDDTYLCLTIQQYDQPKLFIYFPSYTDSDIEATADITQAITFSFFFPEDC